MDLCSGCRTIELNLKLGELIDLGVQEKIVDKAGAWYSYSGQRIGQGRDNVRQFLKEHPEMAEEIEQRLREQLMPKPEVVEKAEEPAEVEE